MTDQLDADTQKLIEKGKALGLKQAANMKPETLKKRIAEAEQQNKQIDSLSIDIDPLAREKLLEHGFNFNHLKMRAREYKIDQLVFDRKKQAFGCFRNGDLIDFLDVGAF